MIYGSTQKIKGDEELRVLVKVLKEFGYYDLHKPEEKIHVELKHLNYLIKTDYVEIVVNNLGNNLDYDEEYNKTESFEKMDWEKEKLWNQHNDICRIQIRKPQCPRR